MNQNSQPTAGGEKQEVTKTRKGRKYSELSEEAKKKNIQSVKRYQKEHLKKLTVFVQKDFFEKMQNFMSENGINTISGCVKQALEEMIEKKENER